MVTIGVALFCWPSWRGRAMRILTAVVIAAAMFAIVIADSRSAMAAVTIGAATFAIWRYRWRGALFIGIAAVVIFAILLVLGAGAIPYLNRHDVTSLTGRTEVWRFSLGRLARSPLVGYGYSVEGEIFKNKYFPLWDDLWMQGPRIPIHNAYLSRAIGLGVPALLLWIFLFLRPFVDLFSRRIDPMNLKPLAILIVLPELILNLSETLGGDCRYPAGLVCTLIWAMFEIQRLKRIDDGAAVAIEATRASGS
jgi:O-antigen ligase